MVWVIIQFIGSIALIVGGISGEFVLRGTNSSPALVAVGILWLIFDIIQVVSSLKNAGVKVKIKKERKGRSPLFFILCSIYILTNLFCIFLLLDEINVPGATNLEGIAIFGNLISIVGIILLFLKKQIGIIISLVGSAISIAFTILSGVFIIGLDSHFDTGGFIGFMLMGILPGILLWLQLKLTKRGTSDATNE